MKCEICGKRVLFGKIECFQGLFHCKDCKEDAIQMHMRDGF